MLEELDKVLANIDEDDMMTDSSESDEVIDQSIEGADNSFSATENDESDIHLTALADQEESSDEVEVPAFACEYSVRGSVTWNRMEPYIIEIDAKKISEESLNLKKSFYYIFSPKLEDDLIREVKKAYINFIRRPSNNIFTEYKDFLYKQIISEIEELVDYFEVGPGCRNLFIYHVGPLTLYQMLYRKFMDHSYGFCYKTYKNNQSVRFLPDEFLKDIILKWFEENVNILDLDFDSLMAFEEIKGLVSQKFYEEKKKFRTMVEDINKKSSSSENVKLNELIKVKGDEWFGTSNIIIYDRFLGKTIF